MQICNLKIPAFPKSSFHHPATVCLCSRSKRASFFSFPSNSPTLVSLAPFFLTRMQPFLFYLACIKCLGVFAIFLYVSLIYLFGSCSRWPDQPFYKFRSLKKRLTLLNYIWIRRLTDFQALSFCPEDPGVLYFPLLRLALVGPAVEENLKISIRSSLKFNCCLIHRFATDNIGISWKCVSFLFR